MVALAEIVLFLTPFVLFALWRVLAPHASRVAIAVALLVALLLALAAIGLFRRTHMQSGERYVPAATLPDGSVVPGHAEP